MSTDTRNALEKALDEAIAIWAKIEQIASKRRVDRFGTTIVVVRERDDWAFTVLRCFPVAGEWQVSVDLQSANDWEVFDYLLELAEKGWEAADAD